MLVNEIFNSIDGEVNGFTQGQFSTFIRFSKCNLKCSYCDTRYAQDEDGGVEMEITDILRKVKEIGCNKITITGGEPLLQSEEELYSLIMILLGRGHKVTVETNGSVSISEKYRYITNLCWIVDYKLPSSNMWNLNRVEDVLKFFMGTISEGNWIKFVIHDRTDYEEALRVKSKFSSSCKIKFAFSPMFVPEEHINTTANRLVNWLKQDKQFDSVINLQLHKLIDLLEEKK